MEYKEAIEILNEERDYSQFPCYVTRAIEIATSAIGKQIPKNPIQRTFINDSGVEGYYYICPCCGREYYGIYSEANFCHDCGQALDWSDIE